MYGFDSQTRLECSCLKIAIQTSFKLYLSSKLNHRAPMWHWKSHHIQLLGGSKAQSDTKLARKRVVSHFGVDSVRSREWARKQPRRRLEWQCPVIDIALLNFAPCQLLLHPVKTLRKSFSLFVNITGAGSTDIGRMHRWHYVWFDF